MKSILISAVIHKKTILFSAVLFIFLTGCDAAVITPTVSLPAFITATLPPTTLPISTVTLPPPTIIPTIVPIAGRTTTEVNVRTETSTVSASLGTLPAFSPVQILGRDVSGLWMQIVFNDGVGWVRADYVQADDATAKIPVLGTGSGSGSAGRGVALRGVNVRSGPGADFASLGLLNQNDVVPVLGKDASGAWFQIEYASAADGKGWVAAEFLQVENAEAVAVLDVSPQATEVTAPETVQAQTSSQTAPLDNDSVSAPLAMFTLAANAVEKIQFQGSVSAPDGDGEDWLAFSANSKVVAIRASCESNIFQVELFRSNDASAIIAFGCNESRQVQIQPEQVYLLKITPTHKNEIIYIGYEIKIEIIGP